MGEVYRAKDTRLDRDVAVKVLPAGSVGDAQVEPRFDREARGRRQWAAGEHGVRLAGLHESPGVHDAVRRVDSNGRSIAFTSSSDPKNIWVQPIDGGDPHALTGFTDKTILDFAWSPDGKRLAITRGTALGDMVLINGIR